MNHFGICVPKSLLLLLAEAWEQIRSMGERSAVRPKSGEAVRQSVPALRRPTPLSTAGRKPAARPPCDFPPPPDSKIDFRSLPGMGSQRKTGRGAGQSPDIQSRREAPRSFRRSDQAALTLPHSLDDSEVASLIRFFETLDRWDREFRSSNSNSFEVTL
jgi:hypothetical protein